MKEKSILRKKRSVGHTWIFKDVRAWLIMLPMIIVFYLFVWRPTVMGAWWSFYNMKGYSPQEFIGLRNYIEVITDTQFPTVMWNTVQYVLWSLVIGYLPPLAIALALNEVIYGKSFFRTIMYLPVVIPGIAAMLMWYFIYFPDQTGLLNQVVMLFGLEPQGWLNDPNMVIILLIIQMTWKSFGGAVLMYFAALQGVSVDLYEASTIDGAGMFKKIKYITIPQISGVMLLTFVNQIIGVFQVLQEPMIMTGGGPDGASISMGYQLYRYGFVSARAGHAMALGVIIFAVLLVLTVVYKIMDKRIQENN